MVIHQQLPERVQEPSLRRIRRRGRVLGRAPVATALEFVLLSVQRDHRRQSERTGLFVELSNEPAELPDRQHGKCGQLILLFSSPTSSVLGNHDYHHLRLKF